MFYKIDNEMNYRIFSLNNDKGFNDAINILNAKPFELVENLIDGGYMQNKKLLYQYQMMAELIILIFQ